MEFSEGEWQEFALRNDFWLAILNEINKRDSLLMSYLREGDPEKRWTDQEIRARINELEFVKRTPEFFILDIALQRREKKGE